MRKHISFAMAAAIMALGMIFWAKSSVLAGMTPSDNASDAAPPGPIGTSPRPRSSARSNRPDTGSAITR
jgi:hypothetical protein